MRRDPRRHHSCTYVLPNMCVSQHFNILPMPKRTPYDLTFRDCLATTEECCTTLTLHLTQQQVCLEIGCADTVLLDNTARRDRHCTCTAQSASTPCLSIMMIHDTLTNRFTC